MSQGIHSTRRDLILEPLAGSWYDESRFSGGNLMASCTPQESQGILHHTVGFWPWPLLWLQICKYAKRPRAKGQGPRAKGQGPRAKGQGPRAGSAGQRAEPQGQSHKGRPQGQLPSTPPSFIASQSQSHSPRSTHTRRVTNRSPSALRCHHTVREQKIRYGTGWWLGYLTISGLGTLTALQFTYNFATDCTVQ